ncbi:hypothetical protein [Buttiauxella ferragutiae]|uniref:hypothetical protein n=1 Tax=Buttiauxella ferragutiae TaxID=82989 RepID=UPI001F52FE37|nr:hypothetical protein [Buttiauxella ferragutiae]UNK63601.1 hypothetical protein MNO13_12195 [Buttiauxella ferragutiae]
MFSKDHRIDMHINNGLFNGKIIYIHYTSKEGLAAIKMQRKISANPNRARRGDNAKKGVYLALAKDAMNNTYAHNLLFLGEKKYEASAMYCIVFVFNTTCYLHSAPVSSGSPATEVISLDDIYFNKINILYDGQNPFI